MELEQLAYSPLKSEAESRKTYFVVGDLESFSANVLYSISRPLKIGGSGPLRPIPEMKYVNETFRSDSHPPFGNHLNYEVWMKKIGTKENRSLKLTNIHIPLDLDR